MRLIRDGELSTATSTFTQLLSSGRCDVALCGEIRSDECYGTTTVSNYTFETKIFFSDTAEMIPTDDNSIIISLLLREYGFRAQELCEQGGGPGVSFTIPFFPCP